MENSGKACWEEGTGGAKVICRNEYDVINLSKIRTPGGTRCWQGPRDRAVLQLLAGLSTCAYFLERNLSIPLGSLNVSSSGGLFRG